MGTYEPRESDYLTITTEGKTARILPTSWLDKFDVPILGLGNIKKPSQARDSIAAVFDLEGFTRFCGQIEPQLSVPLFLSRFLDWLLNRLKNEAIVKSHPEGSELFNPLPFLVKFLGDGLLVLWDSTKMSNLVRRNVLTNAQIICQSYSDEFLPSIEARVVDPPSALRCGLARGTLYSVGDGNDYVGPCINMAARLQKLPGVKFAFNIRGFEILEDEDDEFSAAIVIRRVAIRGIGDNELIAIPIEDFESMSDEDSTTYRAP